jgi:hypothetical protein
VDDGSGDIVVGELRNDDGLWFVDDDKFDAGDEPFGNFDRLDGGNELQLRSGVGDSGGNLRHVDGLYV